MGKHYYFDKIRIILKNSREDLIGLPSEIEVLAGNKIARKHLFKSKIEVSSPGMKFLNFLYEHETSLGEYKISYIEIAKDVNYDSKTNSLKDFECLLKCLMKKYTYEHSHYDSFEFEMNGKLSKRVRREDRERMYSPKTGYWGNEKHKLVIYPRISKVTNKPCIHSEWRICGSYQIKKVAKITSVRDLIDFEFESFFRSHSRRFIVLAEIDHEKHGRFLKNISSKKHAEKMNIKRGNFLYKKAERASHTFCRINRIKTSESLETYYKLNQNRLKKKEMKTVWENKISKLSRNKLKSFFKKIPYNNLYMLMDLA